MCVIPGYRVEREKERRGRETASKEVEMAFAVWEKRGRDERRDEWLQQRRVRGDASSCCLCLCSICVCVYDNLLLCSSKERVREGE